jgi:hypothetical protein
LTPQVKSICGAHVNAIPDDSSPLKEVQVSQLK